MTVEPPLPAFTFVVTLNRADAYLPAAQAALVSLVALGEFCYAGGLGAELEVMAHPEGGRNDFVHQLPVRHSWNRIVLRHRPRSRAMDLVPARPTAVPWCPPGRNDHAAYAERHPSHGVGLPWWSSCQMDRPGAGCDGQQGRH
jgi:hypothetical protein